MSTIGHLLIDIPILIFILSMLRKVGLTVFLLLC